MVGGVNFAVARFFGDPRTVVELLPIQSSGSHLFIYDAYAKNDKLRLSFVNGKIRIEDLNGVYITARVGTGNGTPVVEVDPALITSHNVATGDIRVGTFLGSDRVIIDSSLAEWGKTILWYSTETNDVLRIEDASGIRSVVAGYYGYYARLTCPRTDSGWFAHCPHYGELACH